jgi:hypothetical protein
MPTTTCDHDGRPCSGVIGDCLCPCPTCDLRRRTGLDPLSWSQAAQAEHDAAGPEHAGWCPGPVSHGAYNDPEPGECAICPPGQCPGPSCPGWLGAEPPEQCPSPCSVCGPGGCSPDCLTCAAETAAYAAWLAETDHDCPRDQFLQDPITVASGMGSEMVHLIQCRVCDLTGEIHDALEALAPLLDPRQDGEAAP